MKSVRIPHRMKHLDKDPRGYPIPAMVYRDKNGRPHFTINEESTRLLLLFEQKCSICGQDLGKNQIRWFVGGPLSAFHPHGAYRDPPLHRECMEYAMRVCPYLALPSYGKRIDAKTVTEAEEHRIFVDVTQIPERPALFVCVGAVRQSIIGNAKYVAPERPYNKVQYWQYGFRIDPQEAYKIMADHYQGGKDGIEL